MKQSAGILLFRKRTKQTEVLLAHPGGPFWKKKDNGAWTIPKGEYENDEEPLSAAIREFKEETGIDIEGAFIELTPIRQRSGKIVRAWALEADPDISGFKSNSFLLEWPPGTGKKIEVPEIDQLVWFTIDQAMKKMLPAQLPLLHELVGSLSK